MLGEQCFCKSWVSACSGVRAPEVDAECWLNMFVELIRRWLSLFVFKNLCHT